MSDQKVHVIANLVINDKDTYRVYEKGFFPLLKKYNGEFITFDNEAKHLNPPTEGFGFFKKKGDDIPIV